MFGVLPGLCGLQDWLLADISPVQLPAKQQRSSMDAAGHVADAAKQPDAAHSAGKTRSRRKALRSIPEEGLPAASRNGTSSCPSAAGCALALALALEASGSQYTSSVPAGMSTCRLALSHEPLPVPARRCCSQCSSCSKIC